jgi:two-component system, cell cycle sensor histidine kinase and response regulator CckA
MPESLQGTPKTILVVDDNAGVLKLVTGILADENFHVLKANNAAEALALAGRTSGKIDLLLSDVDMPHMAGPDLGEALRAIRPDMRVMLMSGGGVDGNLLVMNYGWAFIQKPFVKTKLLQMVTDVLSSPDRSQPGGQEFDSRVDGENKA